LITLLPAVTVATSNGNLINDKYCWRNYSHCRSGIFAPDISALGFVSEYTQKVDLTH